MDLGWLEVFGAVARRGSFTAAASSLRYTQSAVSRQISALEEDVGCALFVRLPRGVRLTEEGRCLLDHADAVLQRLDTARHDLAALRGLRAGRLRIGAFPTAEAVLVPRAMAAFRSAHPEVSLSLTDGLTPAHVARMRAGELDVAIVSVPLGQTVDLAGLRLRHLVDDPLLVAIPKGHRLAHRKTLRLAELVDEHWIAGSATVEDTLIGACLRSGFRPRVHYVVREWTAKHGLVAAGLGITLVAGIAVQAARGDMLIKRLHRDDTPTRAVYAATPPGPDDPPAVTEFLRILTRTVAQLRPDNSAHSEPATSVPRP